MERAATRIKPQFDYSIFDAERYFSGVHETRENRSSSSKTRTSANNERLSLSIPRVSSVSDDSYGRNYRGRTTASSEASWNSQIGLLIHPTSLAPTSIRNLPIAGDQTSRKTRASMKWFLRGNKCPCAGKKSVDVEECNSENEAMKTPPPPPRIVQLNRIRCSSGGSSVYTTAQSSPNIKPNLIPDQAIRNFIARPQLNQHKLTNPRFSSDQVSVTVKAYADSSGTTSNGFTFPILCNSANSSKRIFNIVQPIKIEAPRESLEVFQLQDGGVSAKSRRESYEDEICSDASSDLFEIESFTTKKSTVLRDSLAIAGVEEDENPSIEANECYPPSEVSVDWSVTTAEGFDRSSLARFSGDGEGRRRGNGGGLLTSCRREKAVNVGPNPIKYRQAQRGGM